MNIHCVEPICCGVNGQISPTSHPQETSIGGDSYCDFAWFEPEDTRTGCKQNFMKIGMFMTCSDLRKNIRSSSPRQHLFSQVRRRNARSKQSDTHSPPIQTDAKSDGGKGYVSTRKKWNQWYKRRLQPRGTGFLGVVKYESAV